MQDHDFFLGGFQFLFHLEGREQFRVDFLLVEAELILGVVSDLSPQLFDFMLQHFVLLPQFLLAEELSIVLALKFLDGPPEFEDFLFLFGDGFEVVRLPDEDLVRVVDDLPQFNVFSLELSDLKVFFKEFIAQIFLQFGSRPFVALVDHGFTIGVQFSLQFSDSFFIGDGFFPEFVF